MIPSCNCLLPLGPNSPNIARIAKAVSVLVQGCISQHKNLCSMQNSTISMQNMGTDINLSIGSLVTWSESKVDLWLRDKEDPGARAVVPFVLNSD